MFGTDPYSGLLMFQIPPNFLLCRLGEVLYETNIVIDRLELPG